MRRAAHDQTAFSALGARFLSSRRARMPPSAIALPQAATAPPPPPAAAAYAASPSAQRRRLRIYLAPRASRAAARRDAWACVHRVLSALRAESHESRRHEAPAGSWATATLAVVVYIVPYFKSRPTHLYLAPRTKTPWQSYSRHAVARAAGGAPRRSTAPGCRGYCRGTTGATPHRRLGRRSHATRARHP